MIEWAIIDSAGAARCRGPIPAPTGTALTAGSYVYVCPRCGVAWATRTVDAQPYQSLMLPCWRHGDQYQIGGALYLSWSPSDNDALPPELVRREFLLTLQHHESYHDNY